MYGSNVRLGMCITTRMSGRVASRLFSFTWPTITMASKVESGETLGETLLAVSVRAASGGGVQVGVGSHT